VNFNYLLSEQKGRPYELRIEIVTFTIECQIAYKRMLHKNTFSHTVTLPHLQCDSECRKLPNLSDAFIWVHIFFPNLFKTFPTHSPRVKSFHLPQFCQQVGIIDNVQRVIQNRFALLAHNAAAHHESLHLEMAGMPAPFCGRKKLFNH
jgi:hypothetical protein